MGATCDSNEKKRNPNIVGLAESNSNVFRVKREKEEVDIAKQYSNNDSQSQEPDQQTSDLKLDNKNQDETEIKMETLEPKKLTHYNIIRTCGLGFFSKVYLCESAKNKHQKFAIKTIKKKLLDNEKAKFHISNEIRLINKLKFDFIIPIIDIFDLNNREYIVYPYYGLDLFTLIKVEKKQIPENIIKIILSQVYSAISYLHDNKIIYRDLKPENVMLDRENGTIKLIDFGLAKEVKDSEKLKEICGTNEYIPPEVINKNPYSYDFDEWTFGIFCYEIFFGVTPFQGETKQEIFDSILYDELEFPASRENISEELEDLLTSLIQKEKNERMEWQNIPYHPFFTASKIKFEYINSQETTEPNQELRKQLSDYLRSIKVKHKELIVDYQSVQRNKM